MNVIHLIATLLRGHDPHEVQTWRIEGKIDRLRHIEEADRKSVEEWRESKS